ncbi:ankyrin repeat domain-containing protein [Aporhodopirellula aestuarii]|uniref:Ankyrin repeat domain-containing protein n=1 Tax=Aporhodopirellula aestuarii TaxID=2950107 RepID=A0ABT0UBY5_9BACT|nr:ankyrin repeat domain-containing protein [Aporhodopirellula aestuarii]MCM2374384.1 ankyrin repeat domain-containing protein [Aporhodopirellula aestuarii]
MLEFARNIPMHVAGEFRWLQQLAIPRRRPLIGVPLHQYGHSTLESSDQTMPAVDTLIELIRDHRSMDALRMLEASPALATEHSDRPGELHGASPLHWAAHHNAPEVCQCLIEHGANVNDSASAWWLTPLSWGADAGSAEAVEVLLKYGADVNQDAIVGTTALHAVAMGGSTQGKGDPNAYKRTAEILIRNGADINRRTNKHRTPLDEAIDNENDAVAKVLRQHGALASNTSN